MLQIFQAASDRKNNWCSRFSSCLNLVSQIRSCCCCWKFWLVWNPDVAVYNVHLHLDRYHDSTDQSRVQVCSCGISKSFGSPYTSPFGESVLPTFWRKNTKINTIWNVNLSFNCVFWRWKGQSGSESLWSFLPLGFKFNSHTVIYWRNWRKVKLHPHCKQFEKVHRCGLKGFHWHGHSCLLPL